MTWWYAVVEARHDIQNPTNPDKIRLLGRRLGLSPDSRVLDVASGKCGPALVLAETFGCRLTCVERSAEFVADARERVQASAAGDRIEVIQADAREFEPEPGAFDAALCIGASFAYGGLEPTVRALAGAARPGGFVAVGEPYWKRWPLPPEFQPDAEEDFVTLPGTVERLTAAGATPLSVIASSEDDWDAYETLHWLALDDWLRAHPDDPDAEAFARRGREARDRYLCWERDLLGWAMFLART